MTKKFNYAKQFNKNEQVKTEEVKTDEPIQKPVISNEPTNVEDKPVVRYGVVSGCQRLNVREGCSKETESVAVITEGTKVTILGERGNDDVNEICDWFKITTANGKINGYCMAKFITVK